MAEPNRKQRRAAEAQARKSKGKSAAEKTAKEAVLEVAKRAQKADENFQEVTLSTGVKAILRPVSPALIQDVQVAIPDPEVPKVWIEEKKREYENPTSPAYLKALERAADQRVQAVLDAQIMFGVELVDGIEVPDEWVGRLKLLAKRHGMPFDESDPYEIEFAYKKAGINNDHLIILGQLSGMSEEDIAAFRDLFRGQEARDTDS
jgi:hypothetical protein